MYRAHCAVIFAIAQLSCWFFQSPAAETPAWILTLNTSNDVVLRKEVPFEGYKDEISYLTDFENSKKLTLFQWGNL